MNSNGDSVNPGGPLCQAPVGFESSVEPVIAHRCSSCPGGRSCLKCRIGYYEFDCRYDYEVEDVDRVVTFPSLDSNLSSSVVKAEVVSADGGSCWNRQQKRGYNRVLSCLQYWQSNGYQMLWVMLSSPVGGDRSLMADRHDRLRRMVERKGFPGIEHFQVRTSEGNGVLHVIWAWKSRDGFRSKSFYVDQKWLSSMWCMVHGAKIVWICRIGSHRRDVFKVARYCIGQYVGGQSGYEYMSYSWKRSFGFPVASCWRKFKELFQSFNELVYEWSRFLSGDLIFCGYGGFTMGSIRQGYKDYGRDFWSMLHWI